jgi:hypothetical protein
MGELGELCVMLREAIRGLEQEEPGLEQRCNQVLIPLLARASQSLPLSEFRLIIQEQAKNLAR